MPSEPYADMGPLPPPPAEVSRAASFRLFWFPESFFSVLEPRLGYTGGYSLLFGTL